MKIDKLRSKSKSELKEANKILGRSLRDVMIDDGIDINKIEEQLTQYNKRRKGLLGELVEEFVFGLDVNNRAEADFTTAGVELKTNPLKKHSEKIYVSKERRSSLP